MAARRRRPFSENERLSIVEKYMVQGYALVRLAREYRCTVYRIKGVLKKMNVALRTETDAVPDENAKNLSDFAGQFGFKPERLVGKEFPESLERPDPIPQIEEVFEVQTKPPKRRIVDFGE